MYVFPLSPHYPDPLWVLSPRVERQLREVDHSPPGVKYVHSHTHVFRCIGVKKRGDLCNQATA
jgi:hypothetical protein